MRKVYLIALSASAIALAGCQTSDESAGLSLCGIDCPTIDPGDGGGGDEVKGGNASLSSGDKTIALETGKLKSPASGGLSKLSFGKINEGTADELRTVTYQIDTKSTAASAWPTVKTMTEYKPGAAGTDLSGMGAKRYTEYRSLTSGDSSEPVDEELQVWDFRHSYATQYRNVGSSEAKHQAWSFGGEKTTNMPKAAKASYQGRFGSTAKSENWIDPRPDVQTLSVNNTWRVNGRSDINVDFTKKSVEATLTPETWNAFQTMNGASGFIDVNANDTSDRNHFGFMRSKIKIRGTISGNTYYGSARLDPNEPWVSGDNPAYGAFFGSGANETTGAFAVFGTSPDPIGGTIPINDDRRGYLQHSGVFNGVCLLGGACTP